MIDGAIEKRQSSNRSVKSNCRLHGATRGPNAASAEVGQSITPLDAIGAFGYVLVMSKEVENRKWKQKDSP